MANSTFGGSHVRGSFDFNPEALRNIFLKADIQAKTRLSYLLSAIHRTVTINTAVWQGETLVNWRWSIDAPDELHRDPVENGDPGATSKMALGQEPRRRDNMIGPNESLTVVLAEIQRSIPPVIFLTNTGEVAEDMEQGLVPTPDTARTSGMLALAMREAVLFRVNYGISL